MKRKKTKLQELDVAELLDTEEKLIAYLSAEFEEGDPHYIKIALSNVARARNITELAKKAGMPRASIYRALSENGNPEYETIQKIVKALDMQLVVVPKGARLEIRE
ncbi:MAG: putative addiction module antidote protein [Chitinispirillales bacterium]|jgi:probable addiction module antidote protein|nr:putative addiction module antidote protein [Chitinispirillales bacterium]